MLWNLPFITVVVLTLIGLVTVLLKKNIIKILMGINILNSAVNLFIVALGYRVGGV
ncbi:MAG: NADH-quinone oxidoreductase subunit K, partial [Methanoregula sp.]|nr:NADH-quinone oxidoreductase subunit K [Methanoregula sp.]